MKYINSSSKSNIQPELNLKLQYRDLLSLGDNYHDQDGYIAMPGLSVGNASNVSYVYDITTTKLNTVSRGTHEILIRFLPGNKYSGKCPRCW